MNMKKILEALASISIQDVFERIKENLLTKLRADEKEKDETPKKEKRPSYLKHTIIQMASLMVTLLAFVWFFTNVCLVRTVPTESMANTIHPKDLLVVNGVSYKAKDVKRGDVIIFNESEQTDGDKDLVKRVVAVAGDTLELRDGIVYVNGEATDESEYAVGQTLPNGETLIFTIPRDCVFCLGDNREHSFDSRYWDNPYLDVSQIDGRAILSVGFKDGFHFKAY